MSARDFGVEEGLTERGYLDIVVKSFTDTSKNLHVQKKKSTFAAHFQTITAPLTLFHCSRVGGEKEAFESNAARPKVHRVVVAFPAPRRAAGRCNARIRQRCGRQLR